MTITFYENELTACREALAAKDADLERLQRAVEWLLDNGVGYNALGELVDANSEVIVPPEEFRDFIKPREAQGEQQL